MNDLFGEEKGFQPLADRMRPRKLDDVFGQAHLLAPGKPLRQAIESNKLHSMIFWGPPGTGKTTIARLIAEYSDARFITLSAVLAGVKDIREAIEQARQFPGLTVLFIDEVHRFNKAQQDAFLPHIEDGTILFGLRRHGALLRIDANGGEPEVELDPAPESDSDWVTWPALLPDGERYLFTIQDTSGAISGAIERPRP